MRGACCRSSPRGRKTPVVPAHRLHPPLRQAPHGEVEEPAIPRLHAEGRALLETRSCSPGWPTARRARSGGRDRRARRRRSSARDAGAPRRRRSRRPARPAPARGTRPASSSTCSTMSKAQTRSKLRSANGRAGHGRASSRPGRRLPAARECRPLTSTKCVPGDREAADAGRGRSRVAPVAGRERREQRPGVEALRRDEIARRPERVVEATVAGGRGHDGPVADRLPRVAPRTPGLLAPPEPAWYRPPDGRPRSLCRAPRTDLRGRRGAAAGGHPRSALRSRRRRGRDT